MPREPDAGRQDAGSEPKGRLDARVLGGDPPDAGRARRDAGEPPDAAHVEPPRDAGGRDACARESGRCDDDDPCPNFAHNTTITYAGLSGIAIASGVRPGSATAPLVFYWHGIGSSAREYEFMVPAVLKAVIAEGGVLFSFQGSSGPGDVTCSLAPIYSLRDMDVVDQLAACAVRDRNVDSRRIYTTGCNAGAVFATCLAARRSRYIAAVASNSGGITAPPRFETRDAPALMTMHGAAGSDVVVLDFARASADADRAFRAQGSFVVDCNHEGAHCGGNTLSRDVWEFFLAHPFGTKPSPWLASGLPRGFSTFCTIVP